MSWVNLLRERNKQYGTIKFVDISSDEYSPKGIKTLTTKQYVMGRIHAILSYGTVVTDVEAFRRLYEAVDLGWVYAITKYEPCRPPLEEVLEVRKKKEVKHEMTARFARCRLS
ncbi:unnamed protein product [Camellia sinensis]